MDNSESRTLMLPTSGEVVNLDDPEQVAVVYEGVKNISRMLREVETDLRAALIQAAQRGGYRTSMPLDSAEVSFAYPTDTSWDLDVLSDLLAAGLPQNRWQELVVTTVERKVSAKIANQLEKANPEYAEIIGRARRRVEKPPTVSVKLREGVE